MYELGGLIFRHLVRFSARASRSTREEENSRSGEAAVFEGRDQEARCNGNGLFEQGRSSSEMKRNTTVEAAAGDGAGLAGRPRPKVVKAVRYGRIGLLLHSSQTTSSAAV